MEGVLACWLALHSDISKTVAQGGRYVLGKLVQNLGKRARYTRSLEPTARSFERTRRHLVCSTHCVAFSVLCC